jgi:hypothetical protein
MDTSKRNRLVEELSDQPEPQVVSISQFFDGNDDLGSIGCNLMEHPGIDSFHRILVGLTDRPDVEAVYAQIAELDPGEDCWPFTDTVFVAGTISADALREILSPLEPDEIGPAADFGVPDVVGGRHTVPIYAAWWD